MNSLSGDKIDRLADAIFAGKSVSECARLSGVSETTVRIYRNGVIEELPDKCGCGTPFKHNGNCAWRRERRARTETPEQILNRLAAKLGCEPRQVADRVIRMLEERAK